MARGRGDAVRAILADYVSPMIAQSLIRVGLSRARVAEGTFDRVGLDRELLDEFRRGIAFFLQDPRKQVECLERLTTLLASTAGSAGSASDRVAVAHARLTEPSSSRMDGARARGVVVPILDENGVVDARTRVKALAADIGFRSTDQYKIATVVSELTRNIFRYAGKGEVRFGALDPPRSGLFVIARDEGPGIADLAAVLSESYVSKTGLGRGLQGCRKIMDEFEVVTAPNAGTTVTVRKWL